MDSVPLSPPPPPGASSPVLQANATPIRTPHEVQTINNQHGIVALISFTTTFQDIGCFVLVLFIEKQHTLTARPTILLVYAARVIGGLLAMSCDQTLLARLGPVRLFVVLQALLGLSCLVTALATPSLVLHSLAFVAIGFGSSLNIRLAKAICGRFSAVWNSNWWSLQGTLLGTLVARSLGVWYGYSAFYMLLTGLMLASGWLAMRMFPEDMGTSGRTAEANGVEDVPAQDFRSRYIICDHCGGNSPWARGAGESLEDLESERRLNRSLAWKRFLTTGAGS